jgi:hypothetical protein
MNNATLNSSPLNGITGVISRFSDLPGYVDVSNKEVEDLFAETAVSIESFTDLLGIVQVIPKAYYDFNATVEVASYKNLSASLLLAQQQNASIPTINCKIVDDEISYRDAVTAPSWPLQGQSVVAPDGSILSVGIFGLTDGIGFWRTEDGLEDSNWLSSRTPDYTFRSGEVSEPCNFTISVSDYIAGSYVIDVYYTSAVTGDERSLIHRRSFDKGVSWSSESISSLNVPTGSSLAAMKPKTLTSNSVISAGIFYTEENGLNFYDLNYMYYDGSSWNSAIPWSNEVDTGDWIIDSICCFSEDDKELVYMSGRRDSNDVTNNSIYALALLDMNLSSSEDTWSVLSRLLSLFRQSLQISIAFDTLKYQK